MYNDSREDCDLPLLTVAVVIFVLWIAIVLSVGYIVWHFTMKYW
jgi:nitrate reductase NapE component